LGFVVIAFFSLFSFFGFGCVIIPEPVQSTVALPAVILVEETSFSFPLPSNSNSVNISTDFMPVGIIFLTSEEVIDGLGNHSGSKITYEMFMREASKLQAHNVINLNIDVEIKAERKIIQNRQVIVTTYSYTGTGLAIRYTNSKLETITNSIDDLPDTMIVPIIQTYSEQTVVADMIIDTGPAGGIVFFDKGFISDGWRYLEAAPVDKEFRSNWNNANQQCTQLNINGFTGWRLPTREELDLMYKNLKQKGLGGFDNNWYWSSSQEDNANAWRQNFDNGRQSANLKRDPNRVRAVRSF